MKISHAIPTSNNNGIEQRSNSTCRLRDARSMCASARQFWFYVLNHTRVLNATFSQLGALVNALRAD